MPQIDYSKPLILGFAFSHPTPRIGELVEAYRKAGIPPENIREIEPDILAEWLARGWDLSVYAKGSEQQFEEVSAQGFEFQMSHVLGPYKP